MKNRLGTGLTLSLLFIALGVLSQGVSYWVSSDLLAGVVREREDEKVGAVSRTAARLLDRTSEQVRIAAKVVGADGRLAEALGSAAPHARRVQLAALLDEGIKGLKVDAATVTDDQEVVIHRAHDALRSGDRSQAWGVSEALAGQSVLVSVAEAKRVSIEAIRPLAHGKRIVGTLAVGLRLDHGFFKALGAEVGAELALLERNGTTLAASDSEIERVDLTAIREAYEQKIPIHRFEPETHRSAVYMPVVIVDEAYVVMVRIDSSSPFRMLEQSKTRAAGFALLVLAVSVLVAMLTLGHVLKPLRRLRQRAEEAALELTGSGIQAGSADEVIAVVNVLQTLTDRLAARNQELAAAQAAAETAGATLKATFEASPDGIAALDLDGNLTTCNSAWVAMFEIPAEVVARGQSAEMHAHMAACLKDASALPPGMQDPDQVGADNVVRLMELHDGRTMECRVFAQHSGGACVGMVSTWRDVSGQMRAEQARTASEERARETAALLNSAVDSLDESFTLLDSAGRYAVVNRKFRELNSAIAAHARPGGRYVDALRAAAETGLYVVPPGGIEEFIAARVRRHADPAAPPREQLRSDGIWMLYRDIHLDGGAIITLGLDVTARKKAEQGMREALELAEAANRSKSQFLASMSHEIRTPMNAVLGMAELLEHTALDGEQLRYTNAIAAAGRSLHALLSDILDLAKIEAGKVELERGDFDLGALIDDIGSVYRELASSKGCVFEADVDAAARCRVGGDVTRLRQVIANLLGNAVKFTERGRITLGACRIEAKAADDKRFWLRVSVRDSGIGITAEAMTRLFKPFAQADASTTREYGGTGLGLVICKHLVGLMGGSIHVDSMAARGTHFWFDVPLVPATSVAPVTTQKILAQARFDVRILVAEDNPINQEVISKLLGWSGAQVTVVENGALAERAVREGCFDLVFMDCQMPVMDGFEATRRIRAWEERKVAPVHVPIVALTANALSGDREQCLAAGMTDYLSKPITSARLVEALARHLPERMSAGGGAGTDVPDARAAAPPANAAYGQSVRSNSIAETPAGQVAAAAVPPAQGDATALSIYDPAMLAELPMVADGSQPEMVRQVLDMFMRATEKALGEMEAALGAGDTRTYLRRIHSLKSSSAQVGALRLSREARRQEELARSSVAPDVAWGALLRVEYAGFKAAATDIGSPVQECAGLAA